MNLLKTIVRSGIEAGMSYKTKRSVLISNYFSLILSVALLTIFVFRMTLYATPRVEIHWLIGLIVFALPIVLNRLRLTVVARLILCTAPVIFIWLSFIDNMYDLGHFEITIYDGIRIYLLAVSFIPYLLFDRTQLPLLAVAILPSLLSILFFDFWLRLAGLDVYQHIEVVGQDYHIMWMRTLVAYLVISTVCIAFQSIIQYNDRITTTLLTKVRGNLDKIEEQNKELLRQSQELNVLNDYLEDLVEQKTRSIRHQNEMLVKLSFTNAHKVRGPVARILGLITVSRLETNLSHPWIFEKVEREVKDIDDILLMISRDLDKSMAGHHENVNASR
jgi:hypothetical protein